MAHLEVNGDFYKGNYVEQEFYIERPDPNTGLPVPAIDLPDLYMWVTAEKGGDPIDNAVKKPASMRPGFPGKWFAGFAGTDFDSILFPAIEPTRYAKQRIWVRVKDDNGIVDRSFPRAAYLTGP